MPDTRLGYIPSRDPFGRLGVPLDNALLLEPFPPCGGLEKLFTLHGVGARLESFCINEFPGASAFGSALTILLVSLQSVLEILRMAVVVPARGTTSEDVDVVHRLRN